MKKYKNKKIFFLKPTLLSLGILASLSFIVSDSAYAQSQSQSKSQDSTMVRPDTPSRASLVPTKPGGHTGKRNLPVPTSVTEYTYGTCPAGTTGPTGSNRFIQGYRTVTTYREGGRVVGTVTGDWINVEEDCTGKEIQDVGCPVNQRGNHYQERRIATGDNKKNDYTPWKTTSNTCAYYFVEHRYNTRTQSCPAGYKGSIYQRQNYEYWSDGSHRNVGGWYETSRSCTPNKKSGVGWSRTVRGSPIGASTATVSLDNQSGTLKCSGVHNTTRNEGMGYDTTRYNGNFSVSGEISCNSNGSVANLFGSCNGTTGGDADMCIRVNPVAEIISNDGCNVSVRYHPNGRNGYGATTTTVNTCN